MRVVQVEFVDLFSRDELIDVDDALALDRDRIQLLGLELDVSPFPTS